MCGFILKSTELNNENNINIIFLVYIIYYNLKYKYI
uniref:Uncharacterized protein n=2 Tax=unclassified Caudoviricetes TaxID=2788787 RepID=A0A8S5PJ36_9CAUD|nr:MAG TPA: hypothetical protein [Siphoviridae sp. ctOSJ35]DAE15975.1 MAG TPA: hypothetical protein [Siphoviridae sp. ctIOF8]